MTSTEPSIEADTCGDATEAEFVVVLRARSSARFLPEEGWELKTQRAFHGGMLILWLT